MRWICFGEILPLIIYGAVSMIEGGTRGFNRYTYGAARLYPVADDRFCGPVFLRCLADPEKMQEAFIIPGTEGHPGYEFKVWMKSYALPEHLLQWALILCRVMALLQAGLGVLLVRLSS